MTSRSTPRIDAYDLAPGRVIGGKYEVVKKLGGGWEGEVYQVVETRTGVRRAAKLFFPQRNVRDRAVLLYAKKLERLQRCPIVIQYHHSETLRVRSVDVTCLVSEYVEGTLFNDFVARQRSKRLPPFEAMHLLYPLVRGLEDIHRLGEYHGDLHGGNVLVARSGIFFDVKLVDFYHWGRPSTKHYRDDVADAVRLLYDAVGGRTHYPQQPAFVKDICKGLRKDLIVRQFPTARHLRERLETFEWG